MRGYFTSWDGSGELYEELGTCVGGCNVFGRESSWAIGGYWVWFIRLLFFGCGFRCKLLRKIKQQREWEVVVSSASRARVG